MNLKLMIFRSRQYYNHGWTLLSLPIVFLGFSRNLYNLIDQFTFTKLIFPSFTYFLFIGGFSLIPLSIVLGYIWMKSGFYKEGITVTAMRNPFAYKLAPGRDSVMYFGQVIGQKNMLRLFKQFNTFEGDEESRYLDYIELMEKLDSGGILNE